MERASRLFFFGGGGHVLPYLRAFLYGMAFVWYLRIPEAWEELELNEPWEM